MLALARTAFLLLGLLGGECSQLVHLVRQDPGSREEVEVQWVKFLQTFQILRQVGLAGDLVHCWEVVGLLVGLERLELVRIDANIVPVDIKLRIRVLALRDSPAHIVSRHLFNQGVLGL